jgi:Ca-activated chloride channel family protein
MIILMTDGLPTIGETDVIRITSGFTKANAAGIRLFDFGVGFDVNTTLLDKLAHENRGFAENIKPDENIESFVSAYYAKVQAPILSDVTLDFGGVEVTDVHPRKLTDLFAGGQLVVTGQYKGSGPRKITLRGTSRGKPVEFVYDVAFAAAEENQFIDRIWATREVGYLIDMIQLYGESDELVDEIVRLSTRHGIINEYTAFLADENTDVRDHRTAAASCKEGWG